MRRFPVAICALLVAPAATAGTLELPFTLGPITCRADAGLEADIPGCDLQLSGPEKSGSCVVRTHNAGKHKRHIVQASASPIARRDVPRGPSPLVYSQHGVTCWLMIPAYVDGYRCLRTQSGLDCTACLRGECYRGQMTVREIEDAR